MALRRDLLGADGGRQDDVEAGPAPAAGAFRVHTPAHRGHAVRRPMQSDAAGLRLLRAEAAPEQVGNLTRLDAGAAVAHRQVDPSVLVRPFECGIDVDRALALASLANRLRGIDQQVAQDLRDYDRAAEDRGHALDLGIDMDVDGSGTLR